METNKKWVFRELVKDRNNPVQLIAYAMYKAKKDELAEKTRKGGADEATISSVLEQFHEQVLAVDLDDYREKAKSLVTSVVRSAAEEVALAYAQDANEAAQSHDRKVKALEKRIASAKKDGVKEYNEKVSKYQLQEVSRLRRFFVWFFTWLGGGVSGLLATVITTVFIVGVLSLFSSNKEQRSQMVNNSLKGIVDTLVPDNPTGIVEGQDKPSATEKKQTNKAP